MNPQNPSSEPPEDRRDFEPGQTISPHEPEAEHVPQAPAQTPAESSAPPASPVNAAEERGFFRPDTENPRSTAHDASIDPVSAISAGQPETALPRPDDTSPVSWKASEYIEHEKDQMWYVQLGGATLVVALIVYLITRDMFSTFVVIIAAVLFGVVGSRPPRQLPYRVDAQGLTIGERHYPYGSFRSFSVFVDGGLHSITFMPLKRFAPPISIYYDPADEDRITNVLASHLPLENHKADPVEKLMRKIRF